MESIRISLLGVSKSGKSTFLSGINEIFAKKRVIDKNKNKSLFFESSCGLELKSIIDSMQYESSNVEKEYCYLLKNETMNEIDICLYDYPGSWLSSHYFGNQEILEHGREKVINNLIVGNVIYILIDSILLAHYDQTERNKEILGIDIINEFFKRMIISGEAKKGLTIVTLLTKSDSPLIPSEYKVNNFDLLNKRIIELLGTIYNSTAMNKLKLLYGWKFSIIPISIIGNNNSITKQKDKYNYCNYTRENVVPKPYNVSTAFLYGVYNSLFQFKNEYREKVEKMEYEIIRLCREKEKKFSDKKALNYELQGCIENKKVYVDTLSTITNLYDSARDIIEYLVPKIEL